MPAFGRPPAQPDPPKTFVEIECDGPAARDLFNALELVSDQALGFGGIPRRQAGDITCFRFPDGPNYRCMVRINATKPFVDAVR